MRRISVARFLVVALVVGLAGWSLGWYVHEIQLRNPQFAAFAAVTFCLCLVLALLVWTYKPRWEQA